MNAPSLRHVRSPSPLAPRPGEGSSRLLARILDRPGLLAEVRALSPRELGALVDRVGLEDAGEIVALATTEQIVGLFDADLWRAGRAGAPERFDGARFLLWLEVLLEAGSAFAAARLAELPEDLLALALHRSLLVMRLDHLAVALAADEADDAPAWARRSARRPEALEKMLEGCLYEEVGEHQVMPRAEAGWDAVLDVVLALDRDHHELLHRLLEQCAAMTTELIEETGGITRLLRAEETLEEDVAEGRERRRAAEGFVAPTDAAAFLALAEEPLDPATPLERDVVTRSYLPPWREVAVQLPRRAPRRSRVAVEPGAEAGLPPFARAMRALRDEAPDAYAARAEEVAHLVNVVVAGHAIDGRRARAGEALDLVLAACSEGIARTAAALGRPASTTASALDVVRARPADVLFRIGRARAR
jgi:hypothetical protein